MVMSEGTPRTETKNYVTLLYHMYVGLNTTYTSFGGTSGVLQEFDWSISDIRQMLEAILFDARVMSLGHYRGRQVPRCSSSHKLQSFDHEDHQCCCIFYIPRPS
jgi:hypothetical protein